MFNRDPLQSSIGIRTATVHHYRTCTFDALIRIHMTVALQAVCTTAPPICAHNVVCHVDDLPLTAHCGPGMRYHIYPDSGTYRNHCARRPPAGYLRTVSRRGSETCGLFALSSGQAPISVQCAIHNHVNDTSLALNSIGTHSRVVHSSAGVDIGQEQDNERQAVYFSGN